MELLKDKINKDLYKELKCTNIMQIPKIKKIVLNMALGYEEAKIVKNTGDILTKVAGQTAVVINCKKSVSAFKIRQGMPMALKVTLRGNQLYWFLERFIYAVLPQIRDFHGFSAKGFDQDGNFSCGIADLSNFPELEYGELDKPRGMNINIVFSSRCAYDSYKLLSHLGFVFINEEKMKKEALNG